MLALGLLRLAMPTPGTIAALESMALVRRWALLSDESGITLRGLPAASPADAHLLPVSVAGSAGGLLEGLWQAYPPTLVPGTPPAPPPVLRTPSMSIMHQGRAGQSPEAAAAAAAEARLAAAKGPGRGGGKGGLPTRPAPH